MSDMDLEKAYNKIDNFCCSNHNMLQGNKVKYPNGEEEVIDMFSDYQVNKDDDFCKDVYEMTDALETIKDVIDLQEELGCSLEVRERALKQCEYEGLYFETEDTDGFIRKGVYKCTLNYDGFNKRFYWATDWNAETWLECYKKTWWLKADRSE